MRATLALSVAFLASGLGACAATPPDEDPVQIKLADLDTRLARIERVMANQSLLDLSNQLEALRSDVRAMHNDVDQMSNSLEASRKQQRDLYADLDQRMKVLERRGGPPAPSSAAPALPSTALAASAAGGAGSGAATGVAADAANVGDDKISYQADFNLLKDGQYDRAIPAFQKFLANYLDSSLADNAQYWLGEAYYVNKDYTGALAAFQRVVEKYPQSRKIPDALLKVGYCRYEMQQFDSAKDVLTQVVTRYSDTPAARLAQQRLDKMAAEKH